MKYVVHLSYDGSAYRGWQRQNNVLGVQQVFEECLSRVLNTQIVVLGCGRTDALVHASQYFAQFKTEKELGERFVFIINKVLPKYVRVFDVFQVEDDFNVQNFALERTYRYYLHTSQNPFLNNYSAYYDFDHIDTHKLNDALNAFVGYYDFHSFCKTPDKHVHTMVNIYSAKLYTNRNENLLCIEITGDRFLKGMVRAIVWDAINAATNKSAIENIDNKLQKPSAYPNIQLAHPQGLYLSRVSYAEFTLSSRNEPVWFLLQH